MKNNRGFTLIELILVLVIFTTIMLIAVPSVSSTIERRKEQDMKYKIESLVSAAEVYADINRYQLSKETTTIIQKKDIICSGLINKTQIIDPYDSDYIINVIITYNSVTKTIDWDYGDDTTKELAVDKITC